MAWRAAYCEPRRELFARDNLVAAGLAVFCPFERVTLRQKRRGLNQYVVKTVDQPVWGRYLFVESYDVSVLQQTRGVVDVVRRGRVPIELPLRIVDRLRATAGPDGLLDARDITKPSFSFKGRVGDSFTFGSGSPFAGFLGRLSSVADLDESGEVEAYVNMLGGEVPVKTHFGTVDRIVPQRLKVAA